RQLTLPGRQAAASEDFFDFRQETMRVLLRRLDAYLGRAEAALANLLHFDGNWQAERGDSLADRLGIGAGVDQGGQDHVAATAGEATEVCAAHRILETKNAACGLTLVGPRAVPDPLQRARSRKRHHSETVYVTAR